MSARCSGCRSWGWWLDDLDRLLAGNEAKTARERLTLICMFEELRALAYEGGYDAVRRYARMAAAPAERGDGRRLRAAQLRAGRGLSVSTGATRSCF
jgi:hypothetical protein